MSLVEQLAEGFAAQVRRWAHAQGAGAEWAERAASAARQLSLATSEGHVCIDLASLPSDRAGWREVLLASGVTGTPTAPGAMPMIVDDDDRLYLHRDFDLERRLALRLQRASRQAPQDISAAAVEQLSASFPPTPDAPDWQKLAVALALRQHLTVISGGPGTGKTTTVVQLLACLRVQNPACRIRLAAPTGKAAARMHEALRERAAGLPEPLRAALPDVAFTVHRLLGASPAGYAHHAGRPLALDVLVVDEASMLDLALATRLFEAVPDSARIVLLGDQDQLSAVESGAVFAELSADPGLGPACIADLAAACGTAPQDIVCPPSLERSALRDSTVWLRRNFRFAADSGIGRLVAATRHGDLGQIESLLQEVRADLRWLDDGQASPGAATRQAMRQGFAGYLAVLHRDPCDHAAALAAFARFRVLCAVREGPRGVIAVNEWLTRELLSSRPDTPTAAVLGRPVMVLRNDALLGLFNGDLGLLLPGPDGSLGALFAPTDGGKPRWLPALHLPEHETAFAMTVHKAQGSEFDEVLLLLPASPHRVLSRELLYTALSRARQRINIAAPASVVLAAAAAPTQRRSGLQARLRKG